MKAPEDLPTLPAEFRLNLKGLAKTILLCGALTVTAVLMFCYPGDDRDTDHIIGAIGAVFFGLVTLSCLWGAVRKRLIFTVSAKGIERPKLPLIVWNDIEKFQLVESRSANSKVRKVRIVVGVFLKDKEKYYSGMSASVRLGQEILAQNRQGAPAWLEATFTGVTPEKLLSWMQYYLEKSRQFPL